MKKTKHKIAFIIFSFFIFLSSFSFVHSQDADGRSRIPVKTLDVTIPNPLKGGTRTLPDLVALILDQLVIPLASVVIVCSIIWVGFKFVTSQGNSQEINNQKTNLKYVLIGSAIILGAKGISLAIQGTLSQIVNF